MCLGVPGQIVAITDESWQLGEVEVGGVRRAVNLALVSEPGEPLRALLGRWVLVHVGFAMSCIDEAEARRTLELLQQLAEDTLPQPATGVREE